MAITKTYTIADAAVPELIEVFGQGHDPAGGQTKAQYASAQFDAFVKAQVRRHVREYRHQIAEQAIPTDFGIS